MPLKDYFGDVVGLGISAGLAYSFYTFAKAGREMVQNLKVRIRRGSVKGMRKVGW